MLSFRTKSNIFFFGLCFIIKMYDRSLVIFLHYKIYQLVTNSVEFDHLLSNFI